jgi:D-aminoacyl-tRNA deacylase
MVQILVITSTEDIASMNMRNIFLNSSNFSFKKVESKWHNNELYILENYNTGNEIEQELKGHQIYLGLTAERLIYLDDLKLNATGINPDILIFASRHRSEAARPAFLAHITGNWGLNADFGGKPRELCRASALLLKAGFISLLEQKNNFSLGDFLIDLEVTHHGPTNLEIPLIFMELGSSEKEWEIKEAAEMVSAAIINTIYHYIKFQKEKSIKVGVGFGGTHYAPQFRNLIIEKNIAISFICPKYYIKELDKVMIEQIIKKSSEKIDYFIIDWKGINSEEKQHLIPLLEEYQIPIKKTKDF